MESRKKGEGLPQELLRPLGENAERPLRDEPRERAEGRGGARVERLLAGDTARDHRRCRAERHGHEFGKI